MFRFKRDDETYFTDADMLINPVNCVGVMGAGLAKAFADKCPPNYLERYKEYCHSGLLILGRPYVDISVCMDGRRVAICTLPTKHDWRNPSDPGYITAGLAWLRRLLRAGSYPYRVHLPALGCGLGGLKEEDMLPCFQSFGNSLPDDIKMVYFPVGSR